MDKLEKVELVRKRCNVSYTDAKAALEACDYDVLDALVWLEEAGIAQPQTASYTTDTAYDASTPSPEMMQAQQSYERHSKKTRFSTVWGRIMASLKRICQAGIDTNFVAERDGSRSLSLPLLILVLGVFVWGATIWLLIIGLFFGFRYHLEDVDSTTIDVNEVMDKAADGAETIMNDIFDESE